jgi:hypothetical protein
MRRSVFALLVVLLVALPAPSFAGKRTDGVNVAAIAWAPADSASVHPGVQTFTEGAQCTSNFVFTDGAGAVYIGQSAHCAGTGSATDTNGCLAGSLPLGTPVEVDGASRPGTLVYSSWLTMQARNEQDDFTCRFNDFALVKLDPADYASVNPSIPDWGGPVSLGATTSTLDKIYTYGNSSLRFGVTALSPKEGYSLGQQSGGWNHQVYTVTPGIPGDSGSAVLSADGAALGTLSTVAAAPFPASNGVSDLARTFAYAQSFSGIGGLQLAVGTEPFVGGLLP